MLIDIDRPDDPRLRDFVGLRDAQLRRDDSGRFIAEGVKIIERAFLAGARPRALLLQPRWLEGLGPLLADHPDVPVFLGTEAMIEQVSGFHVHRGALASFDRLTEAPLDELADGRRLFACEDIVDHANLGAIVRVAAGLGWDGLLLSPGSADPLYRRAIKASMGASLTLPWRRMVGTRELARLKGLGWTVVASTLSPSAVDLGSVTPPERLVLLVGTEGSGLSREWLELADMHVRIPMAAGVDSLNVATAAAIMAYQLR